VGIKQHLLEMTALGSSPGKNGFKAYKLYPVGTGLTPKKVIKQAFPTTVAGLVGLN
jgi:hypothetical protein